MRNELDDELERKQFDGESAREDSTRKPLVRKQLQMQPTNVFRKQMTHNFQRQSEFGDRGSVRVHPEMSAAERYNQFLTMKTARSSRKAWFAYKLKEIKESSLFIFHRTDKIRIISGKIIGNKFWETIIFGKLLNKSSIKVLVSIILSSVLLILDNPLNDPEQLKTKVYDIFNKFFTALFAVEMFLKIISTGFLFNSEKNKKAYIRSSWNVIDCVVVIVISYFLSPFHCF